MKLLLITLIVVMGTLDIVLAQNIEYKSFGEGLNVVAEDSSFTMEFHARFQSLYEAQQSLADGSNLVSSFSIRRARLKFDGNIFNSRLSYKIELGLSSNDISTGSEDGNSSGASRIVYDAVLKYKFTNRWEIWFGQTKLPGNRERVVSSANLQFVDRSLVNSRFNIDRDGGIQLRGKYKTGNIIWKPILSWSMGEGRDLTSDNFGGYDYTGRLEILPFGEFKNKGDYFLSDLEREQKPKLAFGFTYDLNQGAVRQQGQLGRFIYDSTNTFYIENDLTTLFMDMIFKYKGFSMLVEYANKYADKEIDGTSRNYNTGSGISIQAGYLLRNNLEFAGRYTNISPDNTIYSNIRETSEYTFGISKYFRGHSLKIQADFSYIDVATATDPDLRFRLQTEMQF